MSGDVMQGNVRNALTLAVVSIISILIVFSLIVVTGFIGLAWTMVLAGLLAIFFGAYTIARPEIIVRIDSFYLAGLQRRDGAIKRVRIEGWLIVTASIVWIGYWLITALS